VTLENPYYEEKAFTFKIIHILMMANKDDVTALQQNKGKQEISIKEKLEMSKMN